MSQFFFHFKDALGHTVDAEGHECPGIEDAEEQAAVTAAALLKDAAAHAKYEDVCVEVTNEDGVTVMTVCASLKVERKL
jgi:hypothetical protein